ncbi:hypothetical protein [Pseudoflavitalea rhizosphaerae]|uniref:hypothetical protein n=1 Tax=Pseudoflavitalea rhizosphaerae TaxID=1884793 RepID=UPI000F8DDF87|nr:hypothetical protein [Pseudoflavitalea rhizosphaerae]
MFKKDNIRLGLALGFIAPLLSLVVYYLIKFRLFSVADFLGYIAANKKVITGIVVPCLILNIALFTLYINTRRDKTAKGIFAVTLVYAIVALLLKFLL